LTIVPIRIVLRACAPALGTNRISWSMVLLGPEIALREIGLTDCSPRCGAALHLPAGQARRSAEMPSEDRNLPLREAWQAEPAPFVKLDDRRGCFRLFMATSAIGRPTLPAHCLDTRAARYGIRVGGIALKRSR